MNILNTVKDGLVEGDVWRLTLELKMDGLSFDSIFTDRSVHGPHPPQTIFFMVGVVVLSGGVRAFQRSRLVW